MNCGERSARATLRPAPSVAVPPAAGSASVVAGGRRTSSAAGTRSTRAAIPMVSCAVRQSKLVTSQPAIGETVIGATPRPAETSETARLRCLTNHPLTAAIIGVKKLPAARPTTTP